MTLIVGIKCSNGIVIGADGAATLGNPIGLRTIIQPMSKLNVIKNKAVIGVSGPVSISQLYSDYLEQNCDSLVNKRAMEICREMRIGFMKDAQVCMQIAALAEKVVGASAQVNILHQVLVAMMSREGAQLIQFDYQCSPEVATVDLPFVAIGSGQSIADPFLAFLRRVFWKDHLPTLPEGSFAAFWTIQHAIDTAPGGIGPPIQMAILEFISGHPVARLLSDPEIMEHDQMRVDAEKYLLRYKEVVQPTSDEAEPPPTPPEPTS